MTNDLLRSIHAMDTAREADNFAPALSGLAYVAETLTSVEALLTLIDDSDAYIGADRLQRDAYMHLGYTCDAMNADTRAMLAPVVDALEVRMGDAFRTIHAPRA